LKKGAKGEKTMTSESSLILRTTAILVCAGALSLCLRRSSAASVLLEPSTQTQLAETGTASIEGRVTRAGTNEAISRARIVVTKAERASLDTALTTLTDGNGNFVLSRLPAGRYRLFVSRDGDVRAEYGQRSPNTAGTPFVLEAGQQLKDLNIAMIPTASISGRVLNRYGEPMGFTNVRAYRYTYVRGQRLLSVVSSVRSNDLGEYRLYWLPPGRYIVSAVPSQAVTGVANMVSVEVGPGAPPRLIKDEEAVPGDVIGISSEIAASMGLVSTAQTGSMYLPVYYPGVTDAQRAASIDVAAGASITGTNFVVEETRAVHIRGQVVTPTPAPAPIRNVTVVLLPRGAAAEDGSSRRVSAQQSGAFDFAGVPPGTYDLLAVTGEPGSALGYGGPANVFISRGAFGTAIPNATAPRLGVRVPLDVLGDDLNNVRLALQTGTNVNGRISIDGTLSTDESRSLLSKTSIHLLSFPYINQLSPIPAPVDSEGVFHLTNVVPGTYRVILDAPQMPRDFYVKAGRYGTADVVSGLLHVDAEERLPMEIVLGTAMGNIEARVTNTSGAPASSATAVLIPDAPFRERIDLFRDAITDEAGKVQIERVIPGNYKLFAWEEVESGEWWDPEFMKTQEARGTPVRISEGSRESVEIRSLPRR
jgi:Carboxypeptidase regulatory-like domain